MIIELEPFDILTNPAERIYALLPFWSNLSSLGAKSARLLIVTDHINYEAALEGFERVAVPFDELPNDLRRYRSYYELNMKKTVRETQYIRLFLIIETMLDEITLMKLISGYGINCKPLGESGVPLPFVSADRGWDTAVDNEGRHWGVIQSDVNQTGAVMAQILHRIFYLDFPTYVAVDIWNYSRSEASEMLRRKSAVADVQGESEKSDHRTKKEASKANQAIDEFYEELNTVGIGLHETRISVAVYGNSAKELSSRLELIKGSCSIDFRGYQAKADTLVEMFSANVSQERDGTLATSNHVAVLSGSALSYARPTNTEGVLIGFDRSHAPVVINLFAKTNNAYNAVVIGQTGAGKTFFILLLMIRSLLTGIRLIIIDPKGDIDLSWLGRDNKGNELCKRVRVGTSESSINIFDPIFPEMTNQIEFALGGLRMLNIFQEGDSIKRSLLDMALYELYKKFEWTSQGAKIPNGLDAPTMIDVQQEVRKAGQKYGGEFEIESQKIAFLMEPFITGSRGKLFGKQTNVDVSLSAPVNIFDVSAFPSRQTGRAMRTMLFSTLFGLVNQGILNRRNKGDYVNIQFFVDEIGVMMRDGVVADYVSDKYKTARSLGVSMIVADQTLNSLLGAVDDQGQRFGNEMFANSLYQFVFFQEGSQMKDLAENFPMMPEAYRKQIHHLPLGQCVAKTPQGTYHLIVTPSELEKKILSSKSEDKVAVKKLIEQMRGELDG